MTGASSERAEEAATRPVPLPPAAFSEDRLLGGRLRLRQPTKGYRAAIDPVLLAAAVPAAPGETALDLGCGVGAAALCLAWRVSGVAVDGLELQPALLRLAVDNAALNRMTDRFRPMAGDILRPPEGLRRAAYDHVLCNPPHLAHGAATAAADPSRAAANLEGEARLVDWVGAALAAARPGGTLCFIHRADRLDELLVALHGEAGGTLIYPLWPAAAGQAGGKPAKRVIVRARKGKAAPARILPGLVLHAIGGGFTPAAEAVLRDGEALPI